MQFVRSSLKDVTERIPKYRSLAEEEVVVWGPLLAILVGSYVGRKASSRNLSMFALMMGVAMLIVLFYLLFDWHAGRLIDLYGFS